MSNKDVSIVFKASDRLSDSIRKMRTNVKGLQSDVEAYGKQKDKIFEEKSHIKPNITKAKQNLKELAKKIKNDLQEAVDYTVFSCVSIPFSDKIEMLGR